MISGTVERNGRKVLDWTAINDDHSQRLSDGVDYYCNVINYPKEFISRFTVTATSYDDLISKLFAEYAKQTGGGL